MRRSVLIIFGLATINTVSAQHLLSSTGGQGSGAGLLVAWSMGESIITTGQGNSMLITQGFHQPITDLNTVVSSVPSGQDWQLFPNPARHTVHLLTSHPDAREAIVHNALGRRVITSAVRDGRAQWAVEDLASGPYLVRITDAHGRDLRTLPFIIQQ